MKKVLFIALAIILVGKVSAQNDNDQNQRNYIEVRGDASASIEPNRINVSVMLSEADTKGKITMEMLEKSFSKSLSVAGVDVKKNVVITGQSSAADKKRGAFLYKSYLVTLENPQTVNELFVALNDNQIKSASISKVWNTRQQEITDSLKVEAAKNAKMTALALSQAVGQSIGEAIQIVDMNYYHPVEGNGFYRANSLMAKSVADSEAESELSQVIFKKITLTQSITARFNLIGK